jgi:CIC family chloride channel protein
VASRICRLLRVRPDHARTLVAAGAGAGIAASFNTPLGGAFFALEIILGGFATEAFAPVVAATVVSTVVGQALLGPRVAFHLPAFHFEHGFELLPYGLLGVLSALLAALFKRTVDLLRDRFGELRLHPVLRTGLAGFGVGVVSLGSSAVMGNGYPWIEGVIAGRMHLTVLAIFLALTLKFLATALTVAGRSGAGLFSASLFMGAMTGIFVGGTTKALFPSLIGDPGAFGMVGMGAFAAAVLHAPVTLSLMLFEMTGNYEIVPPLIALRSESMINLELKRRGVLTRQARRDTVLERVSVSDIARSSDLETALPETPIHELVARFLARPIDVVYLVDARGRYAGMVDLQDIKPHLASPAGHGPASGLARHLPPPMVETAPSARGSCWPASPAARPRPARRTSSSCPTVRPWAWWTSGQRGPG